MVGHVEKVLLLKERGNASMCRCYNGFMYEFLTQGVVGGHGPRACRLDAADRMDSNISLDLLSRPNFESTVSFPT